MSEKANKLLFFLCFDTIKPPRTALNILKSTNYTPTSNQETTMKSSSASNPQKNSPLYNLVFIIVLILTAMPFVLFALIQFAPPSFGSASNSVASADTTPRRLTAAERRAAREEARKETEAAAAAACCAW